MKNFAWVAFSVNIFVVAVFSLFLILSFGNPMLALKWTVIINIVAFFAMFTARITFAWTNIVTSTIAVILGVFLAHGEPIFGITFLHGLLGILLVCGYIIFVVCAMGFALIVSEKNIRLMRGSLIYYCVAGIVICFYAFVNINSPHVFGLM